MTRDELIAALKAATGPSEDLDEAIMLDCYPGLNLKKTEDGWFSNRIRVRVEPHTASIDAAITLVPEGLRWRVSCVPSAGKAFATCATGSIMDPATKEWDAMHKSPAIALCIAALKAGAAPCNT